MISFSALIAQGSTQAWFFIPSAILLGALHGLEPGHSKTMMAAFIIAVKGTVRQAALLGLAATFSHTLVVWGVALGGLYLWHGMKAESSEPYFQLASAVIILGVAIWMFMQTYKNNHPAHHHDHHHHDHDHDHSHHHDHKTYAQDVIEEEYQDAHARAHARDIERRFSGRSVTTGQIILFGLTGGLIPCPAAITLLLLCLQVKQMALGAVLVFSFSIGLALVLVTVGIAAALSLRHIHQRFAGLSLFARKAPYFSSALMALIALYMGLHGWIGLGL